MCLECRWLIIICGNSRDLLYIDQKKKSGDCVKLLGHVVIFNNIPAIFMSLCIAVLRACGRVLW